ncbi:hypothetical protein [Aliikangiella sp. G2MR2-5]|uniref:hypothetical protein n=1 Tax=Aliikangiella sp. G2MR2-5 TaxID=2788943 RepID=UPI0018A9D7A9|nr:hypothetical protein [Aliikangiella sp. G2MR2-5]
MPYKSYFRNAIRSLLITGFILIILNMACAKGAGVEVLVLLGQVSEEAAKERENILKGVSLMQNTIKLIAFLGVSLFMLFVVKGFLLRKSQRISRI